MDLGTEDSVALSGGGYALVFVVHDIADDGVAMLSHIELDATVHLRSGVCELACVGH